jgi:hypothetical protein
MTFPFHPSWLHHRNILWIIQALTMQPPPPPAYYSSILRRNIVFNIFVSRAFNLRPYVSVSILPLTVIRFPNGFTMFCGWMQKLYSLVVLPVSLAFRSYYRPFWQLTFDAINHYQLRYPIPPDLESGCRNQAVKHEPRLTNLAHPCLARTLHKLEHVHSWTQFGLLTSYNGSFETQS